MAYKKRKFRDLEVVIAHVKSSFNNTLVSITTPEGDPIIKSSGGMMGFKGTRKSTPFAATQIGNKLGKDLVDMGVRTIEVNLRGAGSGREPLVRALQASGLRVTKLRDVTPLPHAGCRPPKKRRI